MSISSEKLPSRYLAGGFNGSYSQKPAQLNRKWLPKPRAVVRRVLFPTCSFCDTIEGMTHNEQQDLQRLQAEHDRLVGELFAAQQDLARQQRAAVLLKHMSPEAAQRIGRSLLEQMIAAEGDLAAEEATREFPEYLQEVTHRRQRDKPA